jgi:hypothetical protein
MLEEALSKLSPNLRGSVITPASGEYETARKVYNGMIDRRPDAILGGAYVNFMMDEGIDRIKAKPRRNTVARKRAG